VQPHPEPNPRDDVLVDIVAGRFMATAEVFGRLISVAVQNGVVIMEGTVDSVESKAAAGRLAWTTPGVVDVLNALEVNPGV
jgi:osmotically-inducible protein OsmY